MNNKLKSKSSTTPQPKQVPKTIAKSKRNKTSSIPKQFPNSSSSRFPNSSIIEKDEYIQPISGTTTLTDTSFQVNPGNSTVFPWLAPLANNFQRYVFEELEFYYKPLVSGYSSAGQTGKVVLAFNSDSRDLAVTTAQGLDDMSPNANAMPYQEIRLKIGQEILRHTDARYVRTEILPPGDIKTYDVGALHVGVYSTTGSTAIGELHVRYKVRLIDPVLPGAFVKTFPSQSSALYGTSSAGESITIGTIYYPTLSQYFTGNQYMFNYQGGSNWYCAFPGNYRISYMVKLQDSTGVYPGLTSFATQISWASYITPTTFNAIPQQHVNPAFTASLGTGSVITQESLSHTFIYPLAVGDTLTMEVVTAGLSTDVVTLYGTLLFELIN